MENQTSKQNLYNDVYARYFSKLCLLFIAAYFIIQIFIMSHVLNGTGMDDSEQLVDTSFFALGYGGSQPPLYTWLTSLVFKLFGVSLLSLQIVKFGLLAATFFGVYYALRLSGVSYLTAAAAMLSLFLLPQIGWESQRALSHSVLGTATCAWLLVAFISHARHNTVVTAVLLGVMLACSVLGKFNDCLFIIALFIAAMTISRYRQVLISFNTIIAFAVAALLLVAPLAWMAAHKGAVLARTGKFALDASGNPLLDRLWGTADLITACLGFMVGILVTAAALYLFDRKERAFYAGNKTDGEKLILRIIIIGIFLTWVMVLLTGATNVKDRWMQPVLFLSGPAIVLLFAHKLYPPKTLRRFAYLGIMAAIIAVPLIINYFTLGFFLSGTPNISLLDYKTIYQEIKKEAPFKTVLGADFPLAGNMRLLDPALKSICVENPNAAEKITLPVIVLWADMNNNGAVMPETIKNTLNQRGLTVQGEPKLIKDVRYIHRANHPVNVYYYRIDQ